MSVTVGRPNFSSTNSVGRNDFSVFVLPISDASSSPVDATIRRTTG
jgi:hypothetical protein